MPTSTDDVQISGKFITGTDGVTNGEIDFHSASPVVESGSLDTINYISIINSLGILKFLDTSVTSGGNETIPPIISSIMEIDPSKRTLVLNNSSDETTISLDGINKNLWVGSRVVIYGNAGQMQLEEIFINGRDSKINAGNIYMDGNANQIKVGIGVLIDGNASHINTGGTINIDGNAQQIQVGGAPGGVLIDGIADRINLYNGVVLIDGLANQITLGNTPDQPSAYTCIDGNAMRINMGSVSIDGTYGQLEVGNTFINGFSSQITAGSIFMDGLANQITMDSILLDATAQQIAVGNGFSGGGFSGSGVLIDGNAGDVILQNSDCAEDFEISPTEKVDPGTVMALNDDGKLVQGKQPYDKRVAGVISGAGDLKPGLILGRQVGHVDRVPIALMGRVNCKVDADYKPIDVGDLLTTSATPGHAMKASDPIKSFGSVIGKALRPLKVGCDLIPILVALQ